jgi:DNA end-binding protein Ku
VRAIWKGTISFGLVNIPVALGIATRRSDPSFRTLDQETLQPIKQQYFSPARGDEGEVISREETVKGYEVAKDRFVVLSDEELESVAVERRHTIDIVSFIDVGEVDPVYYDRSYYVQAQEHAQKPYALLLEAVRDTNKAALGKLVLSGKEHLTLLRPAGDALVLELLFYPEDVRDKDEIEDGVRGTEVQPQELQMATQLVENLTRPFEPGDFQNEHKRELMAMIESKLAGEEVVVREAPAAEPVPDLMSALKASLEAAGTKQSEDGDGAAASDGKDKGGGKAKKRSKSAQSNGRAKKPAGSTSK